MVKFWYITWTQCITLWLHELLRAVYDLAQGELPLIKSIEFRIWSRSSYVWTCLPMHVAITLFSIFLSTVLEIFKPSIVLDGISGTLTNNEAIAELWISDARTSRGPNKWKKYKTGRKKQKRLENLRISTFLYLWAIARCLYANFLLLASSCGDPKPSWSKL